MTSRRADRDLLLASGPLLDIKKGMFGLDESPLRSLRGCQIVDVGFPNLEASIEGGGLAFDYLVPGDTRVRRLVVGHNELGSWIEFDDILQDESPKDV